MIRRLYLAIVLDLFNREVVSWSIKLRMIVDVVTDALSMAWFRRKPEAGVVFHSDRGAHASHAMRDRPVEYGMTASVSRKGNCWDDAPTVSFFNSLKNERVHGTRYATGRRPRQACSSTSRSSTTGGATTPRWATARRLSSSRTGSASRQISNQRRHKSGRLEAEKRRTPQARSSWARTIAQPIDEQCHHASRVVGLVVFGRHAQIPDGAQQVIWLDVGAHFARRRSRVE